MVNGGYPRIQVWIQRRLLGQLAREHFDEELAGHRSSDNDTADNGRSKADVDRMRETYLLPEQDREPGARGSYLHKQNPKVYTIVILILLASIVVNACWFTCPVIC
ncbi:LOW QUALITY PROTEIN: hypothetical protein TorRG33x02_167320 [Trema orientale]|uniref:Transmembrane protein n=1 Tax=Trema orientale TaxID=63057 RepID=A0A2P5EPT5_TREOI|nr:LOW QUALITY PROTEIN: hypothetical protein TorRG33x02_167320 [Trema orientale]